MFTKLIPANPFPLPDAIALLEVIILAKFPPNKLPIIGEANVYKKGNEVYWFFALYIKVIYLADDCDEQKYNAEIIHL